MNLIIDLGNSAHKYAVFQKNELIHRGASEKLLPENIEQLFGTYPIKAYIFSSVDSENGDLIPILKTMSAGIELSSATATPVTNKYSTPETLGNDRLASAVGANYFFQGKNVLVVDAGTCIKYDLVDDENCYWGGAISPGLEMRLKAMHNFTARLPLLNPLSSTNYTPVKLIGDSTNGSMLSGAYNGALFEVQGMIDDYASQYRNLTVVITGGDHRFFELHIKRQIFARPNLVLEGLNIILNYNLNKN